MRGFFLLLIFIKINVIIIIENKKIIKSKAIKIHKMFTDYLLIFSIKYVIIIIERKKERPERKCLYEDSALYKIWIRCQP